MKQFICTAPKECVENKDRPDINDPVYQILSSKNYEVGEEISGELVKQVGSPIKIKPFTLKWEDADIDDEWEKLLPQYRRIVVIPVHPEKEEKPDDYTPGSDDEKELTEFASRVSLDSVLNSSQQVTTGMKVITIEFPQHDKLNGMINIISDDFQFHYTYLEMHCGLQCKFEEGDIEYKLIHAACTAIAKNAKVLDAIAPGGSWSKHLSDAIELAESIRAAQPNNKAEEIERLTELLRKEVCQTGGNWPVYSKINNIYKTPDNEK